MKNHIIKLKDRLKDTFKKFEKAIDTLNDAIEKFRHLEDETLIPYLKDSIIQRYEYTVELMWKLLKIYLEYFY
jgi:hypothetical protein